MNLQGFQGIVREFLGTKEVAGTRNSLGFLRNINEILEIPKDSLGFSWGFYRILMEFRGRTASSQAKRQFLRILIILNNS